MMRIFLWFIVLMPACVLASNPQLPATGFHWYTKDPVVKAVKLKPKPMPSLSPYEVLMQKRKETQNKLARALITPSFDATYDYMKVQQEYAKNNQQFVRYWQQVLLLHPELDHTLNFPTNNNAIAIRNDSNNILINKVVAESAKTNGLIFFYRGNSSISQKFATVLMSFVKEHHFSIISVTTDDQHISGLPNPKSIPLNEVQKNLDIHERYMPALFLVNLKTQKMSPLSYGFISLSELKERFLDVATNFKRFSYEGLGEV